jgi:serine/threonine protein kinase
MPIPRFIDDKYELLRELGEGGMGKVFEARHLRTGRHVAVKVIRGAALEPGKRSEALRRFEREARAVGRIESPHVVSVFDTGIDAAGDPYLVMELLRGEDLRGLLRRAAPLAPELAVRIVFQACLGLAAAHEQGVVHRDIKAANLYLARRDQDEVITKLLDFGIAKLRPDPLSAHDSHDLTRSGSVLGSPLYMAPEQAMGASEVDARADIWSLGIVLHEALCGTTPHEQGALGSLILAICSQPPRPVRERAPWVDADLAAVVERALMLDPRDRFQSAGAMGRALAAIAGSDARIRVSSLPVPLEEAESSATPVGDDASASGFDDRRANQDATAEPFTLRNARMDRAPPVATGGRRSTRTVLLAGGAVGLVVAAAVALENARREPPPDAASVTPLAMPAPVSVDAPPRAEPTTPPEPSVVVPPPAKSSTGASPDVGSQKPRRKQGVSEKARSVEQAPAAGSDSARPTHPVPPPATPVSSAPAETTIDRQFD